MKRGNVSCLHGTDLTCNHTSCNTGLLHICIQLQMRACLPVLRQLFPWLHEYVPLALHSLGNTQTVCQSETEKNSIK